MQKANANAKCKMLSHRRKEKKENQKFIDVNSKIFFAKNLSYPFQDILQQ